MIQVSLNKPKRKKLPIILSLIGVLFAAAAALYYTGFFAKADEMSYVTVPVKRQDLRVSVQATGNLEPLRTVTVGIEVSGTLKEVLADYNDQVKVGQVLARLDTIKLESALLSSRAQLEVAKANVQSNEAQYVEATQQNERVRQIFESTNGSYPSQKEMDTAKTAFDRASASLAASKASLEQAKADVSTGEENLKKAVVLSPINGIVLTRTIDVGQTVAASMQTPTLFTIAEDLSKMQVVVAVDEADVGGVKAGQPVIFTVNAYPNREFNGTVRQVRLGSQISSGVVTYNTVVDVDNRDALLRPGMTAQAMIITKLIKDALVAPNVAFRFNPPPPKSSNPMINGMGGARTAWVSGDKLYVLENGAPKLVRVTKGDTDGTLSVVFSDEITEHSQVITSAQQIVK